MIVYFGLWFDARFEVLIFHVLERRRIGEGAYDIFHSSFFVGLFSF
jgi:hypothetical protein